MKLYHTKEGELVLSDRCIYFVPSLEIKEVKQSANSKEKEDSSEKRKDTRPGKSQVLRWPVDTIKDLRKIRYLLVDNALEIFLTIGKTSLLAFPSTKDRDATYAAIEELHPPNYESYDTKVRLQDTFFENSITTKWCKGDISNFAYLIHLNTLAGRTLNDLAQYPVFPWILRDYTSEVLNFDDPSIFRDLSKPMGAQNERRLQGFVSNYKEMQSIKSSIASEGTTAGLDWVYSEPYFYGSHYSNSATVLHYMMRLEPFTTYCKELQGGRFDVADRCFKHVASSWLLASEKSSDTKELIPEFFYLSEFLQVFFDNNTSFYIFRNHTKKNLLLRTSTESILERRNNRQIYRLSLFQRGQKETPGSSCRSTDGHSRVSMSPRTCTTGLTSSLGTNREERRR